MLLNKEEILNSIAQSLSTLDENGLRKSIKDAVEADVSPQEMIRLGISRGMEIVGEKYERGEYFLSELIMAGVTMNEAMDIIRPLLGTESSETKGTVIIGTVEGDLHDLGKNLVITMLTSAGFRVHDLGTDVSPSKFVEKTRELNPNMVCMSALLSVALPKVKETIDTLKEAGLRDKVKILVGGRCLNRTIAIEMGADAYGDDAWNALKSAKELLKFA